MGETHSRTVRKVEGHIPLGTALTGLDIRFIQAVVQNLIVVCSGFKTFWGKFLKAIILLHSNNALKKLMTFTMLQKCIFQTNVLLNILLA